MPPWLQELMKQQSGVYAPSNPNATNVQVSPVATPANPTGAGTGGTLPQGGVQGGDFLDAFTQAIASHLAAQDTLAPQKLQQGNNLLFGRHLGSGGGEITGDNPTGQAGGSPFTNGFFKSGAQRAGVEQSRGAVGDYGPVGYVQPPPQTFLPSVEGDAVEAKYGGAPPKPAPLPGFGGSHGHPLTPQETAAAHLKARQGWQKAIS